jgi:hypothetical protein
MAVENFNPVPQALALLDTGSLGSTLLYLPVSLFFLRYFYIILYSPHEGLDINKFNAMYTKLEKAMDLIVNGFQLNPPSTPL